MKYDFRTFIAVINVIDIIPNKKGIAKVECPGFVIFTGNIYTWSRKGWDIKNKGSEVLYINELGKYVPSQQCKMLIGVIPN